MVTDAARAPIFVIGWGRSGTSLLRSMLNAHPRIHLAQESNFYSWTFKKGPRITTRERLEAFLRSYSFAWLRIDPRIVRERFPDPLPEGRLSEVYAFLLKTKAEQYGKPRYGDKNPLNAGNLVEIFRAFPDARVIRTMRDPRAIVVSHLDMPFSSSSLLLLNVMLRQASRRLSRHLHRILTVRLEDLVADPRPTMARVLDFVGEPWDDAVLDHGRHVPEDDGIPFPWLTPGSRRVEARPPSWPARLSPAWIRMIETRNRPTMQEFGYEPFPLAVEPTALQRAGAVLADLPQAFASVWRVTRALIRLARNPTAAEGQRIAHNLNPRAWAVHPEWRLPEPPAWPK